jgi:starch phosphorylase
MLREVPEALEPLTELALDLRWTWSHGADALWRAVDAEAWELHANPWLILQDVPADRLEALARDSDFVSLLQRVTEERRRDLSTAAWFDEAHPRTALRGVAYFSLEFGFAEGLPLYAGGLGVLAADHVKSASDLGVPIVAVGLLYQEGYFRQVVDATGAQREAYPYNDPLSLPIQPALDPGGGWLHVVLELPGRRLWLRVWRSVAGRATLYLLDSNDPLNGPVDRAITGKLYGGGTEVRLLQELVLGLGGWRVLEAAGAEIDVCHLNEGHAAFAAVERARRFALANGASFAEALWATRAGNVFTTHTPVAAGFDVFPPALLARYFSAFELYSAGEPLDALLTLGRRHPSDTNEAFNMAWLAMRTCSHANSVSRLHGEISRSVFKDLYPRWPLAEVPVQHVTNGVHVPSWDSFRADALWTRCCGKRRWLRTLETVEEAIALVPDEELWALRTDSRHDLVRRARIRFQQQLGQRGEKPGAAARAYEVLDPNALTIGFARRFTDYKRPNLLLSDPERLVRLLTRKHRPAQILVAGKAHPDDDAGKRLVQAWIAFASRPDVRAHVLFLADYDIALAQDLVAGVDVWVNTPRRPWEACGTSGMKVLVNGGLNLSQLDGWWAEAWTASTGWALGGAAVENDAADARELYRILEDEVIPEFYDRDAAGIPRAWVSLIRASMASLTPRFSANRMVREYTERFYLPAAAASRRRSADRGRIARNLASWQNAIAAHWSEVRIGDVTFETTDDGWRVTAHVYPGELPSDSIRVEVYADPRSALERPVCVPMERAEEISGATNDQVWRTALPPNRSESDYTVRVLPYHRDVLVPQEEWRILWSR